MNIICKCRLSAVNLAVLFFYRSHILNITTKNSSKLILNRYIGTVSLSRIPNISITNIKNALSVSNKHFIDGYTNLLTECNKCGKLSLFVNKVSGYCICFSCRLSGQWFNPDQSQAIPYQLEIDEVIANGNLTWARISESLECSADEFNQRQKQILTSCNLHVNNPVAFSEIGGRFSATENAVYFPLKASNGFIVGYKKVHYTDESTAENNDLGTISSSIGEITFPPNDAPGLVTARNDAKLDACIVVATLADFFALSNAELSSYSIICLPYGQQNLPQACLPLFEKYNKIVLWFGNDPLSWDNVRIFAKKFCEDRCYLIRGESAKTVLDSAGRNAQEIAANVVSSAQHVAHAAITTFKSLRQDVLDMLTNTEKVCGVKWRRFPGLNKLLKGHRRGELTIVTGPTGSGKTTFISEYSLDLASQGVCTLWGSFEVRNERLARTMLLQHSRCPDLPKGFDFWADSFQLLPIYFMTFHGQQSLDTVMEAVRHASYVHDVGHIIIDNVQFMLGLSTSPSNPFVDRFYRQDLLIGAFRSFASEANVHVTLVIHPRKERDNEPLSALSIFGGAKASQEADNILIIQNKTLNSLRNKKYLQVAKNRYSGDIGLIPLEFDKSILSFEVKSDK